MPHQKERNCSMTREVILVCLHDCVIQRSRRKIYVIYETPHPMQRRVEYIIMYMKSCSPPHLCDSGTKGVSDNLDETVDGHLYSLDPALRCLNRRSRTSVHNGVTAIRLRRSAQDEGNHLRGHFSPFCLDRANQSCGGKNTETKGQFGVFRNSLAFLLR